MRALMTQGIMSNPVRNSQPKGASTLVGAWPPHPGAPLLERWRLRFARPYPGLPDQAFEEPIFQGRPRPGARLTQVNAVGARRTATIESPATFFLVNDPAGVKRVLVDNVANYPKTDFERCGLTILFGAGLLGSGGEIWRRHRRIMASVFHPTSLGAHLSAMAATSESFRERLDARVGEEIDATREMSILTLRIISEAMFSSDSEEAVHLIGAAFADGGRAEKMSLPTRGRARQKARMERSFPSIDALVYRLVKKRMENEHHRSDLLGRMISARDEAGVQMTEREICDEVLTVFVAGHETTAAAMGWIWYLLSERPCEEARLHEELARVLDGRTPRRDDMQDLVFTRQLIEEVLRFYPPVTGLATRACLADDTICGRIIPAGASIAISPFVMHHHRCLWDDPERFDPDRFSPARRARHHRFSYLPFGAGPHICIGQVLAINELVVILSTLAQTHRLRVAPRARVGFAQHLTFRPANLRMIVERRNNGASPHR